MLLFSKEQWNLLIAELVVVVLGILIAFQVEEWRDERRVANELTETFERLAEETRQNIERCVNLEPRLLSDVVDAEIVYQSLMAGHLSPEDRVRFERGLAGASGFPPFGVRASVVDEMISTGMLKQISNAELRQAIAGLQAIQEFTDRAYPSRRQAIRDLSNVLFGYIRVNAPEVDLSVDTLSGTVEGAAETEPLRSPGDYVGVVQAPNAERESLMEGSLEGVTNIGYEFTELASDRRLVNLFYDALDSRVDMLGSVRSICSAVHAIDAQLSENAT